MEIEKLSPIQRIQRGIDIIPGIIAERFSKDKEADTLHKRIGTGEDVKIDSASDEEEALDIGLRIGQVKAHIKKHVVMLDKRLPALKADLEAFNIAADYLSELKVMREKINQLSEMYAEGDLTEEQYRSLTQKYREFTGRQTVDPVLSRGIELVNKEEEWKREQEEAKLPTPPTAATVYEAKPQIGEDRSLRRRSDPARKPAGEARTDRKEITDEGFELSNGEVITDLPGRLLRIISEAGEVSDATRSMLINRLYPGIDKKDAYKKFSMLVSATRKKLKKHGYILENIKPAGVKSNKKEGYYKISKLEGEATIKTESRILQAPESLIASAASRIIQSLTPASNTNILTNADLRNLPGIPNMNEDDWSLVMESVDLQLGEKRRRLAFVKNRKEPGNDGIYIEQRRRKPLPMVEVWGEEIRVGNRVIKLNPEQMRLLWLFSRMGETPVYRDDLVEIFSSRGKIVKPEDINRIAAELNTRISRLIGRDQVGLISVGGNSKLGHWHKIYDAKIGFREGYHPVHTTRLNALNILFSTDGNPNKDDVIKVLGPTRSGKKKASLHTPQQASYAIGRAISRLDKRLKRKMLTEKELIIYNEMQSYKARMGLKSNRDLMIRINSVLKLNPSETKQKTDVVNGVVTGEVNDLSLAEDVYQLGEEAEYGLWSANDVAIIATAVLGQYDRLEQIFNASNILPLERTKVDNLSKMGVNDPNLEPGAMSEKNRVHLLRTKRSNALNKVINMIYDPEFEDKMHALHKEHIGVWELLMKITEMKGIKAEYGIENVDLRFVELEGIEILRKLFTDPAVEKKTFRILNVRENIDIATIIANREALAGRVHDEAVVYDSNHTKTTEQGKKKKVKQQPKQRKQEKPKKEKKNGISKLEKKDPKIRERIFYTFDIITANHSFVKPIGPKRVLSEFPEISEESLNSFLGQLEARYNANNIPMKPRLGIREIAALYYENMYGVNLTSQQKKKLRQLVDELCSEWFEEK